MNDLLLIDVLDTAFYGSVGYWFELGSYKKKVSNTLYLPQAIVEGNTFNVKDIETGEYLGILSRTNILRAFEELPKEVKANIISEQFDAEDADILVQFAVMGEIVYG